MFFEEGVDPVLGSVPPLRRNLLIAKGKYEFVQGDLTLMKGVRSVVDEISSKVDKINYLCMSQGTLSMAKKDDTDEGIDKKMALHFYSKLVPGLQGLMGIDS